MAIEILMPALSPTMEEGTLAKWLVAEGAEVRSGDVIAEIETDKATMEVEALDDGTIGKILIAAGTEGVKVNSPIAVLLEEGESADAVASAAPAAPVAEMAAPAAQQRRPRRLQRLQRLWLPSRWPAAMLSKSRSAKHCVMRWPRKCAPTTVSLLWARKWPNIRVPTR